MRRKAVAALSAHKQEGLHQLKDDPDEMLRGLSCTYTSFLCTQRLTPHGSLAGQCNVVVHGAEAPRLFFYKKA